VKQLIDLQAELYQLTKDCETIITEYNESKTALDILQATEKQILSKAKITYSGSDANRTTEALASKEYSEYIDSYKALRKQAGIDKKQYKILEFRQKALITLISSMSKDRF
jgi:hypothetical protein